MNKERGRHVNTDKKIKYRRKIKRYMFWKKNRKKVIVAAVLLAASTIMGCVVWRQTAGYDHGQDQTTFITQGLRVTDFPEYDGKVYIVLNEGVPYFSEEDINTLSGEYYGELDELGRCTGAYAVLHQSMMPDRQREEIGMIKPTGWVQNKYPGVVDSNPPYLYNRCHMIAYAMTGQNANEKNLITGTRYFNVAGMLPWEMKILKYLESNKNHVLYRVTPYFRKRELLARGVEMEAFSLEDRGKGICFHVFVYNVQPGIEIDYATGENRPESGR